MKMSVSRIRNVLFVGFACIMIFIGFIYSGSEHLSMAGKVVDGSREATLQSYRTSQSLKSLANGYELTVNEYYSTVLEFPVYQRKVIEQQTEIERELAMLSILKSGDANAVIELNKAFKEMKIYRAELESALSARNKDWDGAREALFKLDLVSVKLIQQTDILARISMERAVALDHDWQVHQSKALSDLNGAMVVGLIVIVLILTGIFLLGRNPPVHEYS